ncbi:Polyisoprenoid-binding protein YceI [Reichenbachiella agariperforans]|uniref:Polyisoprenoid-binding protein YceI n=1 Tax=Reichenbachiella agariperforans TaxID=156994 RepID=A0A1M6SZK4_REIAG|nr:YceI family protein [Reichenbachiella agariperforans]SHK50131.1 Polyisoprenoid-binding protein YceI [Reichenbachiella agariperforans]
MKKVNILTALVAVIALSAFTIKASIDWKISDDFSIKFTSEDPTGVFTKMDGDVSFDPDDLQSSRFDVKVDVSSINTGRGMQNKHAVSDKWFDADNYPTIDFTSKSFAKTATGYEVTGTLQIHGVAKEFTMPFTFENEVFSSSFTINRLDFKVGTSKGMSAKVPEELSIDITVPVTRK